MKTLIIIGVIVVVAFGWLVWEVKSAPLGYEDEYGFHYGKDPRE